jgi:hypothetical protein
MGDNWLHSATLLLKKGRFCSRENIRYGRSSTTPSKKPRFFTRINSPVSLHLKPVRWCGPKEKALKPNQVIRREECVEIVHHGDHLIMAPTSGNNGTTTLNSSNTKAF